MTPDDLGVRHAYADVNGLRMHYVEKGNGPLVVLLHGFPEMWWSWRYQIPALVEAGFRVVAPDLRGYNETDAKGPYDIDTLRDDVVALIDHLGAKKAIIVAHDWGGGVAWHLASTRQERCEKLVVMNCPHPVVLMRALMGTWGQLKWSQIRRSWYMFFFQLPFFPERMLTAGGGQGVVRALRGMAVDKANFNDEEMKPFVDAVLMPGRPTGMVNWYRAMFKRSLRDGRGAMKPYGTISVPTLLIWAMEDTALGYADVVPGIERYVPGIEVFKIPECGHFVQQERPEAVNPKLVGFLKRAQQSIGSVTAR
ncbi:MAG: alpha/beta fold hydrolase [Polyangiaceae bacterium]|jgi:epoxide hydrolase 4